MSAMLCHAAFHQPAQRGEFLWQFQPSGDDLASAANHHFACWKLWDRDHKVAPAIADETLDIPFIVALSRTAVTIPDQGMGQESAEQRRALACSIRYDLCHQAAIVVVDDRLRHGPEERKRMDVAIDPDSMGEARCNDCPVAGRPESDCGYGQARCHARIADVFQRPNLFDVAGSRRDHDGCQSGAGGYSRTRLQGRDQIHG